MNFEWQWCFGIKCNLVVKVIVYNGRNKIKEEDDLVFICCKCGYEWCFVCQEEFYWLVLCVEVVFFFFQIEIYEKFIRVKIGGIILVNVKRCFYCRYFIEKY